MLPCFRVGEPPQGALLPLLRRVPGNAVGFAFQGASSVCPDRVGGGASPPLRGFSLGPDDLGPASGLPRPEQRGVTPGGHPPRMHLRAGMGETPGPSDCLPGVSSAARDGGFHRPHLEEVNERGGLPVRLKSETPDSTRGHGRAGGL